VGGKLEFTFSSRFGITTIHNGKKWPFCFIGGLAVIRWGEISASTG